jgi:hypothetical protein
VIILSTQIALLPILAECRLHMITFWRHVITTFTVRLCCRLARARSISRLFFPLFFNLILTINRTNLYLTLSNFPHPIMPQVIQCCPWPPVKSRAPLACTCARRGRALTQECPFFQQFPIEIRTMIYKLVITTSDRITISVTRDWEVRKSSKRTLCPY